MTRRLDRMTAHIINAALTIRFTRGVSVAARTLIDRNIPFETVFRVLHQPEFRRRPDRDQAVR